MGLDIDYVFAKKELEKLEKILSSIEHGKRGDICDDIIKLVNKIEKKYVINK